MIEKRTYQKEKAHLRPKIEWGRWRAWLRSVWEKERRFSVKRDQIKWERKLRWAICRKHGAWWIERCQALIFAKWSYQGAIERCPQQSDLNGSRSYRAYKNFLNRSRIYWDKFSKTSMDWKCNNSCQERKIKMLNR